MGVREIGWEGVDWMHLDVVNLLSPKYIILILTSSLHLFLPE
jgi:hypothetical protein